MQVKDVMTANPVMLQGTETVAEAARHMRDRDIGDVIVLDDGEMCGMVTDRDIVIRAIAEARSAETTKLADICSRDLVTLSSTDPVEAAVQMMRDHALRRLPVMENGRPVGVVSIGDLAVERDPDSALADISAAPPNH